MAATDLLATAYIAAIAQAASTTGIGYILFPELGALAHDIFARPQGTWASAPAMLILTPTITAILGIFIAQHMTYGVLSMALSTVGGVAVIAILRSPIAPALSAGLLPLVFDIRTWWYPLSIALSTSVLALLSLLHRNWQVRNGSVLKPSLDGRIADIIEQPPVHYGWVPFFSAFLVCTIVLAQATGWRSVLVPPLVVTGFEMFSHADVCPWAQRPTVLPLICVLSATSGLFFRYWLGTGPLSAACVVFVGIVILRAAKIHVPPAVAIGLLPLLVATPGYTYPLAVGVGSVVLTVTFVFYRRYRLLRTI